jgi:prepilin-type N-terminal cleavage/methylation domain-containing protein
VLRGRATSARADRLDRRNEDRDRSTGHTRDRAGDCAADAGYTLVEVLVSLALMGMVVSSILPAMWSAVRVSRFSDTQAKVEAVLGSAVDRVSNYGWHPCPETDSLGGYGAKAKNAAAIFEWPASTVNVLEVKYWSTATKTWTSTNPVSSGDCGRTNISITKESTLQRVTLQVISPDGKQTNQLDLVMGDIRSDEERDATQG